MISRLTTSAAIFAFVVTAGLAAAAEAHSQRSSSSADAPVMVTLPMVVVTGHRTAR